MPDNRLYCRNPTYLRTPDGRLVKVAPAHWWARCPECDEKVGHKARKYDWEPAVPCRTRKEALDALRRHRKAEHRLGQVKTAGSA